MSLDDFSRAQAKTFADLCCCRCDHGVRRGGCRARRLGRRDRWVAVQRDRGRAQQQMPYRDSAAELNLTLLMAQEDKYAISRGRSGLCLDAAGGSRAEGAPVTAAD